MDGGAILIHDQVQAFALGERLNETTAVIHIEKANPEFKGIYPMMTQAYAKRWQGVTKHISLEQDLGEPGLRRAKESYYPDYLGREVRGAALRVRAPVGRPRDARRVGPHWSSSVPESSGASAQSRRRRSP
jgi:hypothetical protein